MPPAPARLRLVQGSGAAPVPRVTCCAVARAQVCHRLDQYTTGVLVMSRTKDGNRVFKDALMARTGMSKTYKALTTKPVPLGVLEHYMYNGYVRMAAQLAMFADMHRQPRAITRHFLKLLLCHTQAIQRRGAGA